MDLYSLYIFISIYLDNGWDNIIKYLELFRYFHKTLILTEESRFHNYYDNVLNMYCWSGTPARTLFIANSTLALNEKVKHNS